MKIAVSTYTALLPLLLTAVASAQSPPPGMSARAAAHILEQATWGPTPSTIQALQSAGFDKWFADQTTASPSVIPNQPLSGPDGLADSDIQPLQTAFFQNTLLGNDQLRQRVAFALSEIWVVSNRDLNDASAFPPILQIFSQRAFDNYEALMKDVTLNPAMGSYLDMANNDKADPTLGSAANENYAREFMQLFVTGLEETNLAGVPKLDTNGNPIPTFTQNTVANLAKAFTGWTYSPKPGAAMSLHNPPYYLSPMVAVSSLHDTSAKALFPGVTLPAGQTAEQDVAGAMAAVFARPSVAPFVSKQLIQHLVTSNPSPAYVQRVASVFANDGTGVRGNLKAVIKQILIDREARAGDSPNGQPNPNFGHLREPVLFVANLLRGLNGRLNNPTYVSAAPAVQGQDLFNAVSVFSYFGPNSRLASGLLGPEFDVYNTQNAVVRTNEVNSAVYAQDFDSGTRFDLTPFITAAKSPNQTNLLDMINLLFFHQAMSDALRSPIYQAMSLEYAPSGKATAALYVALSSSEFNIIH